MYNVGVVSDIGTDKVVGTGDSGYLD